MCFICVECFLFFSFLFFNWLFKRIVIQCVLFECISRTLRTMYLIHDR